MSLTLPRYSFDAHFKDKGNNKRPLTLMSAGYEQVANFQRGKFAFQLLGAFLDTLEGRLLLSGDNFSS